MKSIWARDLKCETRNLGACYVGGGAEGGSGENANGGSSPHKQPSLMAHQSAYQPFAPDELNPINPTTNALPASVSNPAGVAGSQSQPNPAAMASIILALMRAKSSGQGKNFS